MWKHLIILCFLNLSVLSGEVDKDIIIFSGQHNEYDSILGEEFPLEIDVKRQHLSSGKVLNLSISMDFDTEGRVKMISKPSIKLASGSSIDLTVQAIGIGVVNVRVKFICQQDQVMIVTPNNDEAVNFVIRVGHSTWTRMITQALGWFYVVLWNLSFYPQVIDNFRRRRYI